MLAVKSRERLCYLVSDAPAEHHVSVHAPFIHIQAHLGQFSPQHAAFDQVDLSDVWHIPQTSAQTQAEGCFTDRMLRLRVWCWFLSLICLMDSSVVGLADFLDFF